MSSGRSSAQAPCPAQATGFTRNCFPMSAPILLGGGRGSGCRQERARVRAAAPPLLVQPGLGREDAQRAADEPDAAIRVVAGAAAGDQAGPALEIGHGPAV